MCTLFGPERTTAREKQRRGSTGPVDRRPSQKGTGGRIEGAGRGSSQVIQQRRGESGPGSYQPS
jgi:hypothetical protein